MLQINVPPKQIVAALGEVGLKSRIEMTSPSHNEPEFFMLFRGARCLGGAPYP